MYIVCTPKIDTRPRHILLLKNPQFLPNSFETWSKGPLYQSVKLSKSQKNWVKIVDFLIRAYFWALRQFRVYILYITKNDLKSHILIIFKLKIVALLSKTYFQTKIGTFQYYLRTHCVNVQKILIGCLLFFQNSLRQKHKNLEWSCQ